MRYDADLLNDVEQGRLPPTIRFFRFNAPTMSFGRLQKINDVAALLPAGWASVQRPTGGGVVFHKDDVCFSLCWQAGQTPLPGRPQDQYRWIHSVVLVALRDESLLRMAACCDVTPAAEPFAKRTCFQNPVGFDLLKQEKKILGGALRCTRRATLYQGSIQMPLSLSQETRLHAAFEAGVNAGS